MSRYCDLAPGHPLHGPYHDTEYGFPSRDPTVLFERYMLEVFQAGLSWELVLARRAALRAAFAGFDIQTVASLDDPALDRIACNPAIIRNRLKIRATRHNAQAFIAIAQSHGSVADWLDAHHPLPLPDWVRLFRRQFKFVGPEIVGEFLMSLGWLPGAHRETCPVFARVVAETPRWLKD